MKKTLIALLSLLMTTALIASCKNGTEDEQSKSNVSSENNVSSETMSESDVDESIGGDESTSDDSTSDESTSDDDTPTIKVEAPSRQISGIVGNNVNLKKYLITDSEEEYAVTFSYTFDGYGEMGQNGAQALTVTEPIAIDGENMTLSYCGEYTIWFVATQGEAVVSEQGASFSIVSEDMSEPTISVAQDIVYEENEVAVSEFLAKNVTVTDAYYKALSVSVTKVNGAEIAGETISLVEGNNTVEVSVEDGFGHTATATANVTLTTLINEDLSALSSYGGKVTHDFDEYASLLDFESSALANSIVTKENAINGKSLLLDNANSAPSVAFLKNNTLSLNGQYRVTFDYKVLTDNAPSYFCVGFNGTAQLNRENWFDGRTDVKGETYQFEHTFTLAEGEYYFQMFNLFADDSQIVIDNIVIENVTSQDTQKVSDLNEYGGTLTHNFDDKTIFGDYYCSDVQKANVSIGKDNAIAGKSITLDNTGVNPNIYFFLTENLALNGQYKVTFDYKVLTDNMPNYFCVGFNGTAQQNRENWFIGRMDVKGETYQFEHTFTLAEGAYYLQIFNLNADGSQIVIDNIVIKNVTSQNTQSIADLAKVGGKVTQDFDDKVIFGEHYCPNYGENVSITTENAISGKSMTIDNTEHNPTAIFFVTERLALNGQYKVTFDYKVLTDNMPNYFCVGFNGTAQQNRENWFSGRTDVKGETYQFEHTFTLAEGEYYFQIFNLFADGSQIVIDNITIEKIN